MGFEEDYDDWKTFDSEGERAMRRKDELEEARLKFADDLFEEYFKGNSSAIEWIDDRFFEHENELRNFLYYMRVTKGSTDRYMGIIAKTCDIIAFGIDDVEEIQKLREEHNIWGD